MTTQTNRIKAMTTAVLVALVLLWAGAADANNRTGNPQQAAEELQRLEDQQPVSRPTASQRPGTRPGQRPGGRPTGRPGGGRPTEGSRPTEETEERNAENNWGWPEGMGKGYRDKQGRFILYAAWAALFTFAGVIEAAHNSFWIELSHRKTMSSAYGDREGAAHAVCYDPECTPSNDWAKYRFCNSTGGGWVKTATEEDTLRNRWEAAGEKCHAGFVNVFVVHPKTQKSTLVARVESCERTSVRQIRVLHVNGTYTGMKLKHGCVQPWKHDSMPTIDWDGYTVVDTMDNLPPVDHPKEAQGTFWAHVASRQKDKSSVLMRCYENYYKTKNKGRAKWTVSVPTAANSLLNTEGFETKGRRCKNGFVDVCVQGWNHDCKVIGHMFPCPGKVTYGIVTAFSGPDAIKFPASQSKQRIPGARMRVGCVEPWEDEGIPPVEWDGYMTLSNWPGEKHYWQMKNHVASYTPTAADQASSWQVPVGWVPPEPNIRAPSNEEAVNYAARVAYADGDHGNLPENMHMPYVSCIVNGNERWRQNKTPADSQSLMENGKLNTKRFKRCGGRSLDGGRPGIVKVCLPSKSGCKTIAELQPCVNKLRYALITEQSGGQNFSSPPGTRMRTACIEPWNGVPKTQAEWEKLDGHKFYQIKWPGEADIK